MSCSWVVSKLVRTKTFAFLQFQRPCFRLYASTYRFIPRFTVSICSMLSIAKCGVISFMLARSSAISSVISLASIPWLMSIFAPVSLSCFRSSFALGAARILGSHSLIVPCPFQKLDNSATW